MTLRKLRPGGDLKNKQTIPWGYFFESDVQSRAQSSPAPRSAVGRQGRTLGTRNFYRRNRAVPVLVRMLGFDETEVTTEVITKSTSAYFSHYMIKKGGISVKRA